MPRKSRSRKDKVSMAQTPAAKETTTVKTVLFIFTSWVTSQHNLPALNKRIVDEFCSNYVKPGKWIAFSTVLDLIITDDQMSDAKLAGVTLIPAMQYFQDSTPNLEWLRYHETHYPRLRELENVQYVVGLDNDVAAAAARDIRGRLFPNAELYFVRVVQPGVLVVFDTWDAEKYGLPEFNRTLLKELYKRVNQPLKIYATTLGVEIRENQRMDAEEAGVTLIQGRRAAHLDPGNDPVHFRWLSYHQGYYQGLKNLENIQYVIGYSPMTADAAANIRETLFPDAKLCQINAVHPEYYRTLTIEEHSKLKSTMLRVAKKADLVVSIGPSMYSYFENAFRALSDKFFHHIEILPKVSEFFINHNVTSQNDIKQHEILSYGVVECCDDIVRDYSKIAPAIGRVAMTRKETIGNEVRWNILDIPKEYIDTIHQQLRERLDCDTEVATLHPVCSVSRILTHLQQSHLCVIGLSHTEFGFYGLEAIAAGLPTYAYRYSQIGSFIHKYLNDYEDVVLVQNADEWFKKLQGVLKNLSRAFERANRMKKAYLESKEVEKSYARFAALLTDGKEPCKYLDVAIELNTHQWQQRIGELSAELKIVSQQQPMDKQTVTKLKQNIQEVVGALERCQHSFKKNADEVVEGKRESAERLCLQGNFGINQVGKIENKCLGMSLNFLSIFGLYRFRSCTQTGRFAKLYEPWLITDEMREIATRVDLPLKLQVTYDEKRFEELDSYFIERDGQISKPLKKLHGEISYTFEKQTSFCMEVAQPASPLSQRDTDIEDLFPVGDWKVILFKLDQGLQDQQETIKHLTRIFNLASSVAPRRLSDDVIHMALEITETIHHILSIKQEILYLLGIREFLVTDTQPKELNMKALEPQFEIHGNTVKTIKTKQRSLLVRGLLLCDIRYSTVGSYCNLCSLDFEQTGRLTERQTLVEVLKHQLSKAKEGRYLVEKQYEESLMEFDKAGEEVKHLKDELDRTLKERNEVEKQREQAKQEARLFKTQLDQVIEGKSLLDKQNQERLEELGKAKKIATEKAIETTSLKKTIQDLETKLAESNDLLTKRQAQLSDAETNLAESSDLVTKMQAQLSDAENRAIESDKIKDEFNKAEKEIVQLKDELDQATKAVKQLEDQLEIAVKDKRKIQEELDKELEEKSILQAAAKERSDLETDVQKNTDSGGMFSKLREYVTGTSASNTEPKPIGTKRYVGKTRKLDERYGGQKWTLQELGSWGSGKEPGQFNEPKGLAWYGDQLVVCDTENNRIQILNKNKVVIELIRFDGQFDKEFRPYDVAISPDGHFFITDIGNNQIIICDQNKKIIQIIPQSADIKVVSVTVMAAFIFVTDSKGKSLIKYTIKDGKLVARVSGEFSDPHSVIATSNNHLLVADSDKDVIHVLDSDLNFLNSYRNDRLESPKGLDVDSIGNIYICTKGWNGIVKLSSDGQLDCVLFEGVEYYPWFIAVHDDITTTIAITGWPSPSSSSRSDNQISVYSVST